MKQRFPSLLLALLLTLSLSACGGDVVQTQGSSGSAVHGVVDEGSSGGQIDLPVAEPEENLPEEHEPPEGSVSGGG